MLSENSFVCLNDFYKFYNYSVRISACCNLSWRNQSISVLQMGAYSIMVRRSFDCRKTD